MRTGPTRPWTRVAAHKGDTDSGTWHVDAPGVLSGAFGSAAKWLCGPKKNVLLNL